jgi:hypothetical protein
VVIVDSGEDGRLPRGGRPHERSRLTAGGLVLAVVSPAVPVVAGLVLVAVMGQVRFRWRDIAAAGAAVSAGVLVVVQLVTGNVVRWVYGVPVFGSGWLFRSLLPGVPLGVAAGAVSVGLLERWAAGAAWHPAERRRRAVEDVREDRTVAELMRPDAVAKVPVPVLGVHRGGDLKPWMRGRYVVPPQVQVPAMGVIGESGSGKTVTVERLNWLWAAEGRRLIFADFKGSDPELPERVVAAVLDARPGAVCRVWPSHALNMWQGEATEVVNRLLEVQDYSEPFYKEAAGAAVRLAVEAPRYGLPQSAAEFLDRLDVGWLMTAWEHKPRQAQVRALKAIQGAVEGVQMRYAAFFAALGSRFDGGESWGDADLTVLTIPTLAAPNDAMAAARMVLADFGAFCMNRKPRPERVVFVVDEFSAVTGAAPKVIDLAERVRDAGGMVVACVQNFEGLGRNEGERQRMLDALVTGGVLLHRTGNPAEVLKLAGTRRETEQSWYLDEAGRTGRGTVKMNRVLAIDPDKVRQLPTGSAYAVTHGRSLLMSAIRTQIPRKTVARARALVGEARAEAAELAAIAADLEQQQSTQQQVAAGQAAQAAAKVVRARKPRQPKTGAAQPVLEEVKPWE